MSEGKEQQLKRRKTNVNGNAGNVPARRGDVEEDVEFSPLKDKLQDEPVDVRVIKWILESMGVEKYEPNVIMQLLEFVHRKFCIEKKDDKGVIVGIIMGIL